MLGFLASRTSGCRPAPCRFPCHVYGCMCPLTCKAPPDAGATSPAASETCAAGRGVELYWCRLPQKIRNGSQAAKCRSWKSVGNYVAALAASYAEAPVPVPRGYSLCVSATSDWPDVLLLKSRACDGPCGFHPDSEVSPHDEDKNQIRQAISRPTRCSVQASKFKVLPCTERCLVVMLLLLRFRGWCAMIHIASREQERHTASSRLSLAMYNLKRIQSRSVQQSSST